MPVANVPCGCILTWGEDSEANLAFCEEHDIEYEKWNGTDLGFIKMVATPHYTRMKQAYPPYRDIVYLNS